MGFNIRRGRDIRVAGAPVQAVGDGPTVKSVALEGADFPTLQPALKVEVGDTVAAGQELFVDRSRPEIAFVAPISGKISAVMLGRRRRLDLLSIEAEGNRAVTFDIPQSPDREAVRALLLASGLWPAFRTRPFERIPGPHSVPPAVFVTAIESAPLAADATVVVQAMRELFQAGLDALEKLTDGPVFVCQKPGAPLANASGQIRVIEFRGPHPAGLPGTHIHRLMPVHRGRSVWHIGYQDVIAIGHLLKFGRIWSDRVVSLAGPAVRNPRLVRTRLGANLDDLVANELHEQEAATILSGSPLSGRPSRYLGRYHTQVAVMHPNRARRTSIFPQSIAALFGGNGPGAIIPVSAYDAVLPFDIPVVPLLRALAVGDTETAERLGCLELAEDDMALLSYVCPARIDYRPLLRRVLDEIEGEL